MKTTKNHRIYYFEIREEFNWLDDDERNTSPNYNSLLFFFSLHAVFHSS